MSLTANLLLLAAGTLMNQHDQLIDPAWEVTRKADDAQRAENELHDWWLVSTSGYGRDQNRFYIDRNKMVSMEPVSRAWVDHYALSTLGRLYHEKVLLVANCNDQAPMVQYRTSISYGDNGKLASTETSTAWNDVIPDSSQETLWRFTCHSQPANAIVFVPDGPESDARRFFRRR